MREGGVFLEGKGCLHEEEEKLVVGGGFCLLMLVLVLMLYFLGTKFFALKSMHCCSTRVLIGEL